jgi:hypothetical protein
MPSVRAVLDDATADRAAARLFALIWSHDEDRHVSPFFLMEVHNIEIDFKPVPVQRL